ncbi:hypothetical protein M1293_01840 [Candidatus Parvarchaeota archaeon]|nr:hypothetical protein [Candidatus Parvarchaeota archaeon]
MKEREVISIHYNEIALKGKLRSKFESLLIKNIEYSTGIRPDRLQTRLLLESGGEGVKRLLLLTPGVSWISDGKIIPRDFDLLHDNLREIISKEGSDISLDVKRIDKSFQLTSLDVKLRLAKEFGLALHSGRKKLRIEIMKDSFIINHSVEHGVGGLPVGSAGKVISLFSGGIDSSVAPFEMMKRGCSVDLLHVYAAKDGEKAIDSKVGRIAQRISDVYPIKLYFVPFYIFSMKILSINPRYELVMFKRFLLKLAENLSEAQGYKGIATGDSISQVASQTLDNINAISYGFSIPIFRPLLSNNKDEIINKAKFYGTYEDAITRYKDCCSIVSKNPATSVKQEKVKELEEIIGLDEIVDKTMDMMSVRMFEKKTR